jgi:hypothetical protein
MRNAWTHSLRVTSRSVLRCACIEIRTGRGLEHSTRSLDARGPTPRRAPVEYFIIIVDHSGNFVKLSFVSAKISRVRCKKWRRVTRRERRLPSYSLGIPTRTV